MGNTEKKNRLVQWLKSIHADKNVFTRNFFTIDDLYSIFCNTIDKDTLEQIKFNSFKRLIDSICRNKSYRNLKKRIGRRCENKRNNEYILVDNKELDVKVDDLKVYVSRRNKKKHEYVTKKHKSPTSSIPKSPLSASPTLLPPAAAPLPSSLPPAAAPLPLPAAAPLRSSPPAAAAPLPSSLPPAAAPLPLPAAAPTLLPPAAAPLRSSPPAAAAPLRFSPPAAAAPLPSSLPPAAAAPLPLPAAAPLRSSPPAAAAPLPSSLPPAAAAPLPSSLPPAAASPLPSPAAATPPPPNNFPLLRSFGIVPNFETELNQNIISNLLSELVNLHRQNDRPMEFTYVGNNKPGLVVPIPKSKDYVSFNKNERRYKWIEQVFQFMMKNKNCTIEESDVAIWLLRHIHHICPQEFIQIAIEKGLHIRQTMTTVEAAAMWTESNVSISQARIILQHLYYNFKTRVQVPLTKMSSLCNITDYVYPTFEEFTYKKDGNLSEKIGENVKMWHYCPSQLMKKDFSRLLLSMCKQKDNNVLPSFGYSSKVFPSGTNGVVCVIGADHGAGSSKYTIRINFLHSSQRRERDSIDYGSRTIQFAEIRCKKDFHSIQAKLAPVINDGVDILQSSMLVAVLFDNGEMICEFIPSNATQIKTQTEDTKSYLVYEHNDKTYKDKINGPKCKILTVQPIISQFKVVIAGDLSFYATATGRNGHSHVRCQYCDLSQNEWKSQKHVGNLMTLASLDEYASLKLLNSKADT